ncbi:MAG: hypothetical protein L6420_07150 [Elusimicrobia bacterium]|nr:hypothetical protein [Elusimicrobiota bacterium]
MKILFCIAMFLAIDASVVRALDIASDTWSRTVNLEYTEEACCSGVNGACGATKQESVFQDEIFDTDEFSLTKQEPPTKTEKKTAASNKVEIDVKDDLKTAEKQKLFYPNKRLIIVLGALFGFVFIYFLKKRRKK